MTEHEWRVEKKASQYPTEISIQPGLEFGLNAEVYPVVKSPTSERCIMCGGRGRETIECPFCDEHGMLCRFFLWCDGKVAGVQSIFIEGSIHPGMSRLDIRYWVRLREHVRYIHPPMTSFPQGFLFETLKDADNYAYTMNLEIKKERERNGKN